MRRVARLLALLGPVVVVLGLSKVHARYIANPPYSFHGSPRFAWAIGYIAVLTLVTYGLGLPEVPRTARQALTSSLLASGASAIVLSAVQLIVGSLLMPRFVVFGSALVLVPWQYGLTMAARSGREREESRDQVFLVAAPSEGARLADDLRISPERNAVLVASLQPREARGDGETSWPLIDQVRSTGATVLVIDRLAQADDRVINQAAELHEGGVRVRTLLQFYEDWLGKLPLTELERASLFFDIGELHRARYGRLKRLTDIVLGLLGTIPLVVSVPFVLLGNLIANRGPLLYRQERVGKGGTRFQILKFRTMRPNPAGVPANEWTQENDPRITPFGNLLRVSHLDELPQVINIVRGDLAVVGPRPEQPQYVKELGDKLAFYDLRHLVRPGLTGWAQVKYGYAGHESDALEKLQYEFFYMQHQSLALDGRIIGRTIRSITGGEGRGR
jgi:lipopolysaccharide/colanic/teichoic acid biosynthesis glycosyltransferase